MWFQEVWKKQDKVFFRLKGLLILDSIKAHVKVSIMTLALKKNIGAELFIIPGGLTKILQHPDISVNKSFKSHVHACWKNSILGLHAFTKNRNTRHTSYIKVTQWVDKA